MVPRCHKLAGGGGAQRFCRALLHGPCVRGKGRAALTCARKWFFDAPTWTAALDAGLVTAFVLLVVLHLMKGAR